MPKPKPAETTTTPEAHLQILSAHYSETFNLLKLAVEKRDRLFLYIIGTTFLLLLYMSAPSALSELLNSFITSKTGDAVNGRALVDVSFIGMILLLGLLAFSHTYFQTVLHIERQYGYVYELEEQLSRYFDGKAFIREGTYYKRNKRFFSRWTKFIFWILFPLLYGIFIIAWLAFLFRQFPPLSLYWTVGLLITLGILISLSLYLYALVKKR